MKISKENKKGVCSCCKNVFTAGVDFNINKYFFRHEKLCLKCARDMYEGLGKLFVPKAIKHIFNKSNKLEKT